MPSPEELQQDKGFMSATPADQQRYLMQSDSDFAKAPSDEQAAYLAHVTRAPMADEPQSLPENLGFTAGNMLRNFGQGVSGIAKGGYGMMKDLAQNPNWVSGPNSTMSKFVDQPAEEQVQKAAKDFQGGNPMAGYGHVLASAIPIAGPWAAGLGEQAGTGDVGGATGQAAGTLAAGAALPKIARPILRRAGAGMRMLGETTGYSPRPEVPPEMISRNVRKAVVPAQNEWNNYHQATQQEGPAIVNYARKNGIPLEGKDANLNYEKAARGAAEDANKFYIEKVLGPYAEDMVPTTGSGFVGRNTGEGQRATLGEVNGRVSVINSLLRPAYSKAEPGQTLTTLAPERMAELQAEKAKLVEILHDELAKRNGVRPQDVATLRQTFGRRYTIADETGAATNAREHGTALNEQGRQVPLSKAGVIDRAVTSLRGGPERVADRNLTKALRDYRGGSPHGVAMKPFGGK